MTAKLNDVDPQAWLADRESRRIPLKDINAAPSRNIRARLRLRAGKFSSRNKSRGVTDTFLNDLS